MTEPTPDSIAAALTVPERLLLFCLASDTDWRKAGATHITTQHLLVRGLIGRNRTGERFALTEQGRAVLAALLAKSMAGSKLRPIRQDQP
ncbi:MAG: hypothetical protein ACXWM1_14815, partial [Candidatus Binataceae bacterium]